MFVSIKGSVFRLRDKEYYEAMAHYDDDDDYELCASYSTGVLTGIYTSGDSDLALECHAWGYDGIGPQLLACHILAFYSKEWSPEIARKYYKDFTTEVIANLPVDKPWELTKGQIDRWLKNKQTKTKGKSNERESTETKGGQAG